MPIVRLSGMVLGADDPSRASRARLLYLLYSKGWDIYNSNGDQRITLSNIEKKIVESDAFVFTPGATLEDMFKAVSIFVGFQTLDGNLTGKPTVILNEDGSWDPLFRLLNHLRTLGTVRQRIEDYLVCVYSAEAVVATLERLCEAGLMDGDHTLVEEEDVTVIESPLPDDFIGSACVFCSASMQNPAYLADGERLGRMLAENRIGCVSGAGQSGIMGAVVRGSVEAGGWTAGSNVPHIIRLEGVPDGLASFWLRPDIYSRMEVMIEHSDAFVIFPGGAGTVQELLALIIFKHTDHALLRGKPVVIFNRVDADGVRFWDPLMELLDGHCREDDFVVVETLEEVLSVVRTGM